MRKQILKIINWIIVGCVFLSTPALALSLPLPIIDGAVTYLIQGCNKVSHGCWKEAELRMLRIHFSPGTIFLYDVDGEHQGDSLFTIYILNREKILLKECDIHVENGEIILSDCIIPIKEQT